MADDQTFRVVLILGLVAVMPFGIYHRVRSQATREPLDRRQEGWFILLTLRPIGIAGMAGLIAFVALPVAIRWLGVGVGVGAGALLIWTFRSLGKNITDTVVTRRHHELITTGPYHYVRHPFYLASALAFLANALVTANWFIGAAGALAMTLLFIRTSIEEEYLVRRFGDSYTGYMKSTGRFLPRLSGVVRS